MPTTYRYTNSSTTMHLFSIYSYVKKVMSFITFRKSTPRRVTRGGEQVDYLPGLEKKRKKKTTTKEHQKTKKNIENKPTNQPINLSYQ